MINILVADDDDLSRMRIRRMLIETHGKKNISKFNIKEAENGNVVLRKLENNLFNILIMDIEMPKKNGFEVLAELHNKNTLKDINIILISGYTEGYIKSKVNHFFSKNTINQFFFIGKPINVDSLDLYVNYFLKAIK